MVLFLLIGPKIGFSPRIGATRCPDKGEIWHELSHITFTSIFQRMIIIHHRNLARGAKFHLYQGKNVGIQPTKSLKIRILAINLPLGGHSFALLL